MRGLAGSSVCGTNGGYSAHRKRDEEPCDPCKAARVRYNKQHRWRKHKAGGSVSPDATGTRRRVQALAAIGWSFPELAARLGLEKSTVKNYCDVSRVFEGTAWKVAELYDELSGTPGPSKIARRRAVAKGWLPPLAYDDIDDINEQPRASRLALAA